MLKDQASSQAANIKYLEHQYYEIVREIYETIHASGLYKFTFTLIDSLWDDLNAALHELESLPQTEVKELLEVIENLMTARNELRLARFLFDVEEIHPVYRLLMRNRAVLRGESILEKLIQVWPVL